MPKPKSKKELIEASQKNFFELMNYVHSFSDEEVEKEFPKGTLNRNVRDILAHIHHWHFMMLGWYEKGMSGKKPAMPAEGYTWKTLPDLNKKIQQEYQDVDLETVKALLQESYTKMQQLMIKHSDKELFTKKKYKWTGTTSLGVYFISNTSSHYDWAIKQIKKARLT